MTTFRGPPAQTEDGVGALTMGGLLAEVAPRFATRPALVFHGPDGAVEWTYAELADQARQLATALMGAGVGKGTRVALLMGNRPEWVAAAFAVAMAGGVLVPLNTYFEPPELDYVLRHCDAEVVLLQRGMGDHDYLDQVAALAGRPSGSESPGLPFLRLAVCLELKKGEGRIQPWAWLLDQAGGIPGEVLAARMAEISPYDDGHIIYTSGSTAVPKGVLHAHRSAALQSWRFARLFGLDSDERTWSAYPFFWTAGFAMVMGATLAAGGCLVLQERFEPADALTLLEAERVTTPFAWPHQQAQLEDHPDWAVRDLSAIRHAESFSSFARHPKVRVGDEWSPRSAYGLTETFTIVTAVPAAMNAADRDGHEGAVLPGNALRIVDPDSGQPANRADPGEIAVRGTTLMKGYVKVPPERCFDEDGFFRTGDAGFVDERGRLHWTGRTSDLIKTGGANVSPAEIELALLRHPKLKAALAVGVAHPTLGQQVVVCAVTHEGVSLAEADVRDFLRGRIASYKIPRRVMFFDEHELSFTANAKIRSEQLRALATARLQAEGR
jgi:acyl-CoA synthetase (AMP-forming)/AMP-acid ligase II